jgi:outer membrane scaffolding protein for murein synthesis (MipA/OmpV family)
MSLTTLWLKAVGITVSATLAAPAAFAQAFDAVRLYRASPGVDRGTIGVAAIAATEYRGSDERRTLLLPVLDYLWANGWFAGVTNGVGRNFSDSQGMQYGLRVTADLGRRESRAEALRGMGNIDVRPEVGGFFNYIVSRQVFLTSSLRYGSGDEGTGLVVDLGAGYFTELSPRWRVGVGTAVTYANANYMRSYFGVTTSQAAASGYPAFNPGTGARDARANAALTYEFNHRTSIMTAISMTRLLGDAEDSPLTRRTTSATGMVALSYRF